jgi:hypothetical protein
VASRVLFFAQTSGGGAAAGALGPWDWALATAFAVLLGLETLTDEHQVGQRWTWLFLHAPTQLPWGSCARDPKLKMCCPPEEIGN